MISVFVRIVTVLQGRWRVRVLEATSEGKRHKLNGRVIAQCRRRHRHQEFLDFLRAIDKAVPPELDVHCIADNYASHKHPKVRAWLAQRPRWRMHFVPTYSSWLNQVERSPR